jgi:DNA polymerase-3 subunit gamma/tau
VSYKVLARKWRPQRFEDVIGQRAVTQTLRNAIAGHRIAQSFVFAGPRGVGKTTTARILARALNCQQGPTADPCGVCDACVEIAEGRDMDVLEIDAATHTQVDKVREIIISGIRTAPARDRHKIFIIDEVHRLSPQAFDALLKSVEEPPPHVVFMMATTEIDKVPPTIQSRSQVFELKTIGVRQIADQIRSIAAAERVTIDEAAVMAIARAGDGSMRDAQSAFDQVIAFAGTTITAEDVATVLGLVRRDLLLDMASAVAREDAAAVFQLTDRAVESGYDLRTVLRELGRLTRDLLVISIDPSRLADPEISAEGEQEQLTAAAGLFSHEDLMRAFDLLTKGEDEIRSSMQPRFHLEMTLLRWIHLRKLVPLSELIEGLDRGGTATPGRSQGSTLPPTPPARPPLPQPAARTMAGGSRPAASAAAPPASAPPRAPDVRRPESPPKSGAGKQVETSGSLPAVAPVAPDRFKDAFLEEIKKVRKFFYGTVIAQAQRIHVEDDRVVITFAPQHRALKSQLEQARPLLETIATQLAGRRMTVVPAEGAMLAPDPAGRTGAAGQTDAGDGKKAALREQAMADSGVQAMLDVFAAEIKDVEEM